MKKMIIGLVLVGLFWTVPATISAFTFIESVQDYGVDAAGYNYVSTVDFTDGQATFLNTDYWSHTLNNNYQVGSEGYTIASAVLHIEGWQYEGYGGEILIAGGIGTVTPLHDWQWVNYSYSSLDLTNIADNFWNQDQLYAFLVPMFETGVNLTSATLYIDYDRVSFANENIATPEPATMILMGLGLAGGGLLRRRRKNS